MFLLARSLKWYNFQQVLQANPGVKYLQTEVSRPEKKGFASWWPEDGMTNHHVKLVV
jgi:hypothetical protein